MSRACLVVDHEGGLCRAALWRGKELCALALDREDAPDMTGARVRGKVVRLAPGQKAAWFEAGLPSMIYVESPQPLCAGALQTLRIKTTMEQGKAWQGVLEQGGAGEALGVMTPPPPCWQRLLADGIGPVDLVFCDKADRAAFEASGVQAPGLTLSVRAVEFEREALAEQLAKLTNPRVALPGGLELVIEGTEALWAVDVNAGTGGTPLAHNLAAAKALAREMRLRNLGGLIVVDCLKMRLRPEKARLLEAFKKETASDPAGVTVFDLTKLGLLEMTRARRGPPINHVINQ